MYVFLFIQTQVLSLIRPTCPREQSPMRDSECAVAEHFFPSAVLSIHRDKIPVVDTC